MILIDTDTLSLTRRPGKSPKAAQWLAEQDQDNLYLSVVSIGEVEKGIAQQLRVNPEFAINLRDWLTRTENTFKDRIWDFDIEAARVWGKIAAKIGHNTPDTMIAAIALSRGAMVATMNTRHFEPLGVRVVNPFA
jgi:toxin FitB